MRNDTMRARYRLTIQRARRPVRHWQADSDQEAYAVAIGLVLGEVRRRRGEGVHWRLEDVTGEKLGEEARRVD